MLSSPCAPGALVVVAEGDSPMLGGKERRNKPYKQPVPLSWLRSPVDDMKCIEAGLDSSGGGGVLAPGWTDPLLYGG